MAVASLRSSLPFLATAPEIDRLATGLRALDGLLGGGFARGQLTEVVGAPSTGRTSITHRLLSTVTRRGEIAALVDSSDRFDPRRAEAAGIDLARLLWVRPPDPMAALRACEVLLSTRGFGVVVLDFADGLPPAARARMATVWSRLRLRAASSRTIFLLLARDRLSGGAADVCIALRERRSVWSREGITLLDGIDAAAELVRTRHGTPGARERVQFFDG